MDPNINNLMSAYIFKHSFTVRLKVYIVKREDGVYILKINEV